MIVDPQGLILCSRYSFAPNSLHYCGPERQNDMLGYVDTSSADKGLIEILNRFDTLYAYLVLIASHNHIHDPFDARVVEAYWLGNGLLKNVPQRALASHISENLKLKQKLSAVRHTALMDHVVKRGVPQHNFHVFNIFIRTGHHMVAHTLKTMDSCRISWGRVVGAVGAGGGEEYVVDTEPLVYVGQKLELGKPIKHVVRSVAVKPKIGEWVSVHWGYVCDVLTPLQQRNLRFYTKLALNQANRSRI